MLRQHGRSGLSMRRDCGNGEREQDRRDRRVNLRVVLDLAVAEVEEGLPADVSPGRRVAAQQIVAV